MIPPGFALHHISATQRVEQAGLAVVDMAHDRDDRRARLLSFDRIFVTTGVDVDPYQTVNLYLGVREEQWNVELFATNLFDEEALRAGGGTEATPLVRQEPTGYGQRFPVAGRRVGVSASYRF